MSPLPAQIPCLRLRATARCVCDPGHRRVVSCHLGFAGPRQASSSSQTLFAGQTPVHVIRCTSFTNGLEEESLSGEGRSSDIPDGRPTTHLDNDPSPCARPRSTRFCGRTRSCAGRRPGGRWRTARAAARRSWRWCPARSCWSPMPATAGATSRSC